ncbi:hypothetical protein FQA39_LY10307 [Lamprigera yunnana]|nr:hypothetical protein FQA39_LY10307 [Lamprigera yunnana]
MVYNSDIDKDEDHQEENSESDSEEEEVEEVMKETEMPQNDDNIFTYQDDVSSMKDFNFTKTNMMLVNLHPNVNPYEYFRILVDNNFLAYIIEQTNKIDAIQMTFVIIGACMGALGCMILGVGCLATGATRRKVYRAWRSRVGGRISCAIFMTITYILQIAWILMFCFLAITTFIFTIFWNMCENPQVKELIVCIDFTQFYFLFPRGTKQDHMKVCGENDIKLFCGDYVGKAEFMFILATAATVLIILSLIHYLMCLAANYAHIRDHEKFQELQDLHYLTDPDMVGSKDRF